MYLILALGCQTPSTTDTPLVSTEQITPADSGVVGSGVKGPFLEGGELTVTEIDGQGELTDKVIYGTTDDRGRILVPLIAFPDQCEVEVVGHTFDELEGVDGSTVWALRLVTEIQEFRVVGNVNLLTHLIHQRVKNHMVDADFDVARRLALAELGELVPISHHPAELDLLNTTSTSLERDNAILLSFSVAVLAAAVQPEEFDVLTEDFADNGRIDGSGVPIWNRMRVGENAFYDTARDHLFDRYGSAPPALPPEGVHRWRLGCNELDPTFQALCEGPNDQLSPEVPGGGWADYDFVPARTGSWVIGAEFGTFNNFHRWTLVDQNGTIVGDAGGASDRLGATVILEAGERYTFSAYNAGDVPTSVSVDVSRSSLGSPSDPEYLMNRVAEEGWTTLANAALARPSFFRFDRSQLNVDRDGPLSVVVSDVGSELRLEAFTANLVDSSEEVFSDSTRRIGMASGSQGVRLDDLDPDQVLLLKVVGLDTGFDPTSAVPGRIPFQIRVHGAAEQTRR